MLHQAFNPSLVRLARFSWRSRTWGSGRFQSQLGSIGAGDTSDHHPYQESFQSQLGSIGAHFLWRSATWRPSFQSQLGSIGAKALMAPPYLVEDFQSQLGSIGASSPSTNSQVGFPLSIPAWFDWRPEQQHTPSSNSHGFQSQLGSIGALSLRSASTTPASLSIPAWFDWRRPPQPSAQILHFPFNPSLVRLAQHHPQIPPTHRISFQSQLGSIGASARPHLCHAHVAFNPSLVRLAPLGFCLRRLQELPFNPSLVRLAPAEGCAASPYPGSFQSQLGSIGALERLREYVWKVALSIPAWFDWRMTAFGAPPTACPSFNPSLVRLALYCEPFSPAGDSTFNPSLVRLAPK